MGENVKVDTGKTEHEAKDSIITSDEVICTTHEGHISDAWEDKRN